ncbi:hypothetical protein Ddye_000101 [Dipteronia dyeriana]|uniref:Uncharacterized protein n=1 Tax=Dipteronia dyeriana TaxID=168575 RepID=A0AAE0CS83_9ROSI|nr:hypothetical protein Ddye_000101 [Dipteronia dyeriana]
MKEERISFSIGGDEIRLAWRRESPPTSSDRLHRQRRTDLLGMAAQPGRTGYPALPGPEIQGKTRTLFIRHQLQRCARPVETLVEMSSS